MPSLVPSGLVQLQILASTNWRFIEPPTNARTWALVSGPHASKSRVNR
ncbi:hypothetical protein AB0L53_34365 [Nonomuraea sp. NPDC052129]